MNIEWFKQATCNKLWKTHCSELVWPPCCCWRLCWPWLWCSPLGPLWTQANKNTMTHDNNSTQHKLYRQRDVFTWWCVQNGCRPSRQWHTDSQRAFQLKTQKSVTSVCSNPVFWALTDTDRRGRRWSPSTWAAAPRSAPVDGYCGRASRSDSSSPVSGLSPPRSHLPLPPHPHLFPGLTAGSSSLRADSTKFDETTQADIRLFFIFRTKTRVIMDPLDVVFDTFSQLLQVTLLKTLNYTFIYTVWASKPCCIKPVLFFTWVSSGLVWASKSKFLGSKDGLEQVLSPW